MTRGAGVALSRSLPVSMGMRVDECVCVFVQAAGRACE